MPGARTRWLPSMCIVSIALACGGPEDEPAPAPAEELAEPRGEILFEGPMAGPFIDAFPLLTPGVFLSLPPFPIEPTPDLDDFNPLGLPADVRRALARLEPEIRMRGTDGGIAVEYRGWEQSYVARSRDRRCAVMFDFRVDVREQALASATKFGKIDRPFELIVVLVPPPPGRSGLYVLVIAQVIVNSRLIGQPFAESHTQIGDERGRQGRPTAIASMPRWFVVEHELAHADEIRRAYRAVVDRVVRNNSLCSPTRPNDNHKGQIQAGFDTAWALLTTGGGGGSHENPDYPDTPSETEARKASWREWDARNP